MACNSIPNGLFPPRADSSYSEGDQVSTRPTTGVIEAGDFLIDLRARRVTLRGRELDLTSAEFEVLVFLAGHRKSFVTPHTMLATSNELDERPGLAGGISSCPDVASQETGLRDRLLAALHSN